MKPSSLFTKRVIFVVMGITVLSLLGSLGNLSLYDVVSFIFFSHHKLHASHFPAKNNFPNLKTKIDEPPKIETLRREREMEAEKAGASLDSLIAGFNSRISELQELVIARNSKTRPDYPYSISSQLTLTKSLKCERFSVPGQQRHRSVGR